MGFIFGVVIVIVLGLVALGVWAEHSDRKEARASGVCKYCKKAQAERKLPKGDYACVECYKKEEPKQRALIAKEEADRKARLAEQKPVHVDVDFGTCVYNGFNVGVSDSAGGWDVRLAVTNRTSKEIKYVHVELIPYNTVGDIDYSPTVGAGAKSVQITGPVGPNGRLGGQVVTKFWYDIKLAKVKVGKVRVIFRDGTEKTFQQ